MVLFQMHRARRTFRPLPSVTPAVRDWYHPRIQFALVPRDRLDILGNFEDDLRPIVKLAAERCGQGTLIQQKQAAGVLVPIYDLQAAKIKESFSGVEVLQGLNLDALGQASIR